MFKSVLKGSFLALFLIFTNNLIAQELPAIPQNLVATRNANNNYIITWSDVANNETHYQIDRRGIGETTYIPLGTVAANSNSYTDLTAYSVFDYHYRVRAIGLVGNSEYTYLRAQQPLIVSCGQSLCYPENCTIGYPNNVKYTKTIKANCQDCVLSISFDRFGTESNHDYLNVYDGNSIYAPSLGKFSGSSLPSTLYGSGSVLTLEFFSDFSQNGDGWKFTTACIERPGRPQITSQKELYSSEVTLKWLDNSTNEAGFKIEKSTSPTFASFTTHLLSSNSTEFYFDKLDSATSYYFRVRAFTDRIESYNSPVYTVTTPGSPFQKNEIASINLTENNVHSGWIRMSDINGDKLCDYLVMIPTANDNLLRLYINKGNGSFELAIEFRDTSPPLDIQLADIDNDFDLDVVYKGGYGLVSLINKGSSFEKRIIFKDMVGFSYDCGVLTNDYDSDGDEDIFLYDKTAPSAAWFKNNRNGEFSFDSVSHLKKRFTNVNLVDIDNNGKVDLMADEAYAEKNNFYVNQGGVFQFVPYSPGSISNLLPADTDNDGDIDLVSVNSNRNTIQILINNGTTTFTVSESFSSTTGYFIDRGAPVDIDNDGDTDFVFDSQDGGTVFINKGNNKFVSITNFEFQFYGSTRLIKVLDFDGDSKLDVVMYHEYQKKLVVWKNVMPFITTRPSNPVQLTAVAGVGSATVNWANATDDKTPSASLRYNYYIGKTAVGQEVRSANMFHDNGRYFKLYPQGSNQAVITNLEKGNYYWGVQTVDAALQSSIFSTSTFQISESNYIRPPKGLTLQNYSPYQNNISWVDDSDNEEGFILIRSNTPYSGYKIIATLPANQTSFDDVGLQHFTGYFYRVVAFKGNLRSDLSPILFSQTLPLLSQTFGKFKTTPPVKIADYGNMQWVDLNGDNKRDFIWNGIGELQTYQRTPFKVMQAYLQSETDPWQYNEVMLKFNETNLNIDISGYYSVACADFDNDGDIDLLLGRTEVNTSVRYQQLVVMRNIGNYTYDPITIENIAYTESFSSVNWGDFDNDGDADILASRFANSTAVYKNNGANFSKVFSLPYGGAANWFDYNNDGWLDIVALSQTISGSTLYVHKNTGTGFQLSQTFPGGSSSLVIADIDNDNDEDVFASGLNDVNSTQFAFLKNNSSVNNFEVSNTSLLKTSPYGLSMLDFNNDDRLDLIRTEQVESSMHMYKGSATMQFEKQTHSVGTISSPMFSINDIDGDSDVDIFCIGRTGSSGPNSPTYSLLENNSKVVKPKPNSPINLLVQLHQDTTILTWSLPNAAPGITYNVMVGTAPGKQNIINPLSDPLTGFTKINQIGNTRFARKKVLVGLAPGTYFWNVQSVDANFQGSSFSTGGSFVIGSPALPEPTSFSATPLSSSKIKLTFDEAPANTKRTIYYSKDGIQFTYLNKTDALEVVHSSLDENHTYYYRVLLTDEVNYSVYSSIVIAKTWVRPSIIGADLIVVDEGQSFSIPLTSLPVENAPGYPNGYSLLITPGSHYTVSGNLITPRGQSSDTLHVPVRIASASDTSDTYNVPFKIKFQPTIINADLIAVDEGQSFSIPLTSLQVKNAPGYPTDYSLLIAPGSHYTVSANLITPTIQSSDTLYVPVRIASASDTSDTYNVPFKIKFQPTIVSADLIVVNEDKSFSIPLTSLQVENAPGYPTGYSLLIAPGSHYTVSGNLITPTFQSSDTLYVPVRIASASDTSDTYNVPFKIKFQPTIVSADLIVVNEDKSFSIPLTSLQVENAPGYPTGYSLLIAPGSHYIVSGNLITPTIQSSDTLYVPVRIASASDTSVTYNVPFKIKFQPTIVSADLIVVDEGQSFSIPLTSLQVKNAPGYPTDYSLLIEPGSHYTVSGNLITPTVQSSDTLYVLVQIASASYISDAYYVPFKIKFQPTIVSADLIAVDEGQSFSIPLTSLQVKNAPGYPTDYSLLIEPGSHYTVSGNLITPTVQVSDTLYVPIRIASASDISDIYNFPFKINIITSINELLQVGWMIYPNPVDTEIHILNEQYNGIFTVTIFDNFGRVVFSSKINSKSESVNHTMDFKSFDPGLYMLFIYDDRMGRMGFKIIKN